MNRIRAAFERIRDDETPSELSEKFNVFFEYFEHYWLNIQGPREFCVYRQMRRTNNPAESYIAQMNKHLSKSPSSMTLIGRAFFISFYAFILTFKSSQNGIHFVLLLPERIVFMATEAHLNFLSVTEGICVTRRRFRYIVEDLNLKNAWDEFDAGHLSIDSFLLRASRIIHKSANTLHYTSIDDDPNNNVDGIQYF